MRSYLGLAAVGLLGSSTVLAAPLVPRIESHNFHFGGYQGVTDSDATSFYAPRGDQPDWLTLTGSESDREVTSFWEVWPSGSPLPIFNTLGQFGGDLELYLEFDGEDAGSLFDVSLTGHGRNDGADLIISGTIGSPTGSITGTLLAIDIDIASLFGYGGSSTFIVETAGTITFIHPDLDVDDGTLIGERAVSRGYIDLLELVLSSGYDPLSGENGAYDLFNDGGGYSGEVGVGFETVPEPASLILLAAGLMFIRRH